MAKYRGLFKVKILSKTDGHVLVRALEDYGTIKKGVEWSTRKENIEKEAKTQ